MESNEEANIQQISYSPRGKEVWDIKIWRIRIVVSFAPISLPGLSETLSYFHGGFIWFSLGVWLQIYPLAARVSYLCPYMATVTVVSEYLSKIKQSLALPNLPEG